MTDAQRLAELKAKAASAERIQPLIGYCIYIAKAGRALDRSEPIDWDALVWKLKTALELAYKLRAEAMRMTQHD